MNFDSLKRIVLRKIHFIVFAAKNFHIRRCYLIGVEDFGNLGDHQIGRSIIEFIRETIPQYHIVLITASEFDKQINNLNYFINRKTPIFLTGGGNMGNEYMFAERIRRSVISRFTKAPIVIFPQSVYYKKDNWKEFEISKQIYEKADNLTICVRDSYSLQFMRDNMNVQLLLVPDIVLYSNKCISIKRRNKALIILRSDIEQTLSPHFVTMIKKYLSNYFKEIISVDNQKDYNISFKSNVSELSRLFKEIQTSEIVITDRLHGMIFSAITGTPCIAFSNYNHKIKYSYEWIKNLGYIIFVDNNFADFKKALQNIPLTTAWKYDNGLLKNHFSPLINLMKELTKR